MTNFCPPEMASTWVEYWAKSTGWAEPLTVFGCHRYWSAHEPPGYRMRPVLAAERSVEIAGSRKLVSHAAVLTPSGSSGPDRVALEDPWVGPVQVTAGMGLEVPL